MTENEQYNVEDMRKIALDGLYRATTPESVQIAVLEAELKRANQDLDRDWET